MIKIPKRMHVGLVTNLSACVGVLFFLWHGPNPSFIYSNICLVIQLCGMLLSISGRRKWREAVDIYTAINKGRVDRAGGFMV